MATINRSLAKLQERYPKARYLRGCPRHHRWRGLSCFTSHYPRTLSDTLSVS